jgi:hypothetical protein
MPRHFSATNIAIWQDADWRALPWPAQHVYKMFWDHPRLSYCGVVDWRPARMLGWGSGWTREDFEALTACLIARHFLIVDEQTEELLIRSWVRWDGLMKQPRLAVSFANAFAEVGSNTLRGVIVDELAKLREREPENQGWAKQQVLDVLSQPRVWAKSLPTPTDPFGDGFGITLGNVSPTVSDTFGPNATSGLGVGFGTPYSSTSTSTFTPELPATNGQEDDEAAEPSPTKTARKRASALPEDFEPNDTNRRLAADRGLNLDDVIAQWSDHHRAKGSTFKDWHAALNTWIRREKVQPASRHAVRRLHASEVEQPPDGLSDSEYADWVREQQQKRAAR